MGTFSVYHSLLTCALIVLVAWICSPCRACQGEDILREELLDWVKQRILEGLGLEEAPAVLEQSLTDEGASRAARHRAPRVSREAKVERRHHHQEVSQVIIFPSSDSSCLDTADLPLQNSSSDFTYYFQPSLDSKESIITSAHFWFYAGEAIASDLAQAPLYILTSRQDLIHAAERPARRSADGWITYRLDRHLHAAMVDGPFVLQVRCPACGCYASEEDKTPFLHLHARPRGPDRLRRAPSIPWSPSAIDDLRRPSSQGSDGDCKKEQIEVSFEELGWDNWIVHPKVFNFHYCHGNCSSPERTTTLLGISQCCAPVPESMKSLRFTTTSDGGFSFKYETLPNIIPEECHCI